MRILHTADWHIGRRFHGVSLVDDQAVILEQFVALARDAKPDAIIVAGDVYDRADPPVDAVRLLDETFSRLTRDVGAPLLVIAGNHDNGDRLGFASALLASQGLHIAGRFRAPEDPVIIEDRNGPVAFFLVPYADPPMVRDALDDDTVHGHQAAASATMDHIRALHAFEATERRVAIFHGFVTGGEASDSERPLTVGGTGQIGAEVFDGFAYTALGHLHRPQRIGSDRIRYAGSLMKYSFSEIAHRKSVSLVEIDGAGAVAIEPVELTPRRDLRAVEGALDAVIDGASRDAAPDDYLLVRLTDQTPRLDAMARLRAVYPNVLHVERPVLLQSLQQHSEDPAAMRSRSPLELFEHFYQERRCEALDPQSREALMQVIDTLSVEERDA